MGLNAALVESGVESGETPDSMNLIYSLASEEIVVSEKLGGSSVISSQIRGKAPLEALEAVREDWPLGSLPAGHEFLLLLHPKSNRSRRRYPPGRPAR